MAHKFAMSDNYIRSRVPNEILPDASVHMLYGDAVSDETSALNNASDGDLQGLSLGDFERVIEQVPYVDHPSFNHSEYSIITLESGIQKYDTTSAYLDQFELDENARYFWDE